MSNWKTVRLGDVCVLNYGKSLTATNRKAGVIPVYSSAGITGWHNEPLINDEGIIVGRKGTVGSVYHSKEFFYCIDTAYYVLPDKAYDFRYLYYRLKSLGLEKLNEDSAVPGLNRETAYSQEFLLPPLAEQGRIAGILGALDDKIDCNNRINRNLEEQAAALFRRWFVDFEFPDPDPTSPTYGKPYCSAGGTMQDSHLGSIPQGWQVGTLGEYCKVKSGFAFKSAWWQNNGIKVLKIKNIDSNNTLNLSDCSFVSEDKIILAKDFLVKGGDLLIAMTGATIGKFTIVPSVKEQLLVNQRVGKFFLGDNPIRKLPFLYLLLRQDSIIDEIINRGQGSAQPNISPSDIETIDIVFPNKQIIDVFNNKMQAIFCNLIRITAENRSLSELRDSLLPKLMNNELSLDNLQQ